MESISRGPKFALTDKKLETGHQTRSYSPKKKDFTSLLNISTKFNGIGGNSSSLAIKKTKEVAKPPKSGVFSAVK